MARGPGHHQGARVLCKLAHFKEWAEKKELVEKAKKLLSMKDILRYLDDYALEEESFQLFRREAGQLLQELQ